MCDITFEIKDVVQRLKADRDTWEAIALRYKDAFEAQTKRLSELQGICFATQAELENERCERHRKRTASSPTSHKPSGIDGNEDQRSSCSFGSAIIFPRAEPVRSRRISDDCNNALFYRVHECIDQRNYGSALVEVERLLRGPLSSKARAEGLLLKSSILKASGPEEFYNALAACSEALELCTRLSDLESFLPKIQYQRGILYYKLRMLHHARDAFTCVSDDDSLSAAADNHRRSCDDEIELDRAANRRSAFDEHRTFSEGLIANLDEKGSNVSYSVFITRR